MAQRDIYSTRCAKFNNLNFASLYRHKKALSLNLWILILVFVTGLTVSSVVFFNYNSKKSAPTDDYTEFQLGQGSERKQEFQQSDSQAETEQLLLQEAAKENIEVKDEDVDRIIEQGLEAYNIDKKDLNLQLEEAGITYEEYKQSLKSKIAISELINNNADLKNVTVSNEEVDKFIEGNKNEFIDFFDNEDNLEDLRGMVRSKILQDKQTELVLQYIQSLD